MKLIGFLYVMAVLFFGITIHKAPIHPEHLKWFWTGLLCFGACILVIWVQDDD